MKIKIYLMNRRLHLVLLVATGWFFILGIRYVVPAVLPQIIDEFTITNSIAGFAISILWFMYAIAQFPAGILTDKFGEHVLLTISLILSIVSLIVFASVNIFVIFLVACALYGFSSGIYGTPRATILSRTFPDNSGVVFGFTLAVGSMGGALLPILAGVITAQFAWRAAFLVFIPAVVLISIGVAVVVPTGKPNESQNVERSSGSLSHLFSSVRNREILPVWLAAILMTFAFQAITSFFPVYLIEMKSIPQNQATILYGILFTSGALFQPVSGVLADKFGHRRLLIILTGISVLPFAALPFTAGLIPLGILAIVFGVQHGIVPVNNAYTVRALPADIQGTAWGFIRTTMFAIGALGSIFVGTLADLNLFDESFLILAVVGIITTLLYWMLPKTGPLSQ